MLSNDICMIPHMSSISSTFGSRQGAGPPQVLLLQASMPPKADASEFILPVAKDTGKSWEVD